MGDSGVFLPYLPFWLVNYGLAIVLWSCVGRFLLAWFVPGLQPQNYIWRAFVLLTDWAIAATAFVTPSIIKPYWWPLFAAFWLYWLRIGAFVLMSAQGMVPRLAGGG